MNGKAEPIRVFVRVRPLLPREADSETVVLAQNAAISVDTPGHNVQCAFDGVFPPTATQADVYEQVKQCAASAAEGFNSTLFAYGQTGSGKTFSLRLRSATLR